MSVLALPDGMTIAGVRARFPGALEAIEDLDEDDLLREGYLSLVPDPTGTEHLMIEPEHPSSPYIWHQESEDWYWEEEHPDFKEDDR